MGLKFNPITGQLDLIDSSTSDSFNPDDILTGPSQYVYVGDEDPYSILLDAEGNVLTAA